MAPPPSKETAEQAFQKLRQAFDTVKANHTDPWNWHQYLGDEPKLEENEEDDPEVRSIRPKKRSHVERLKTHLLTTVTELNRASQAADAAYFHMCVKPQMMRECCVILGSAGDIDADMLLGGDASPEKLLAALQGKLDLANLRIKELEGEVGVLQEKLMESRFVSEDRWMQWQRTSMLAEEALGRLNDTTVDLNATREREQQLQAAYYDLYCRWTRASRIMIYKGRQLLRDSVLKQNKKENMFYAFQGFCFIVKNEKEERLRREAEAERNAVEYALRNEVRFLLGEKERTREDLGRVATDRARLKQDRRALAQRILYKHRRPYEDLEYCLWVWELWLPIRKQLRLEKAVEMEEARCDAASQLLSQTSAQLPPMAQRIDDLKIDLIKEQIAHDVSRREITAACGVSVAAMGERLRVQRAQELAVLLRIHKLDVIAKEERIQVLEREIAEDKHIHALKGMVVDLESNLRRALDLRKQRPFVVPQDTGKAGSTKCSQCQRDMLFRTWKCMPSVSVMPPVSEADFRQSGSMQMSSSLKSLNSKGASPQLSVLPSPGDGKQGTYTAVWR